MAPARFLSITLLVVLGTRCSGAGNAGLSDSGTAGGTTGTAGGSTGTAGGSTGTAGGSTGTAGGSTGTAGGRTGGGSQAGGGTASSAGGRGGGTPAGGSAGGGSSGGASTGKKFYLNPATGNDQAQGTLTAPWKTLSKAIGSIQAGDTVFIRGGNYTRAQFARPPDSWVRWTASQRLGSPGLPITIEAAPGETVNIDGTQQPYLVRTEGSSGYPGHFVVFRNLNFTNFRGIAIGAGGKHVAIDGCSFRNFLDQDAGAVGTGDSEAIIIRNSRFENIGVADSHIHPIYISYGTKRLLIDNNFFRGTSGFAIHVYGHGDGTRSYRDLVIRRNTSINPAGPHILVGAANSENTYIYNNTLFSTHAPYPSRSTRDTSSGLYIGTGIQRNFVVQNNIGFGPMATAMVYAPRANVSLTMTHNLFFNTNTQTRDYQFSTQFYSLATLQTSLNYGSASLSENPRFENEAQLDLRLKSTSNAIDRGSFLTTASRGGSGRSLPVVDSRYFNDGFGVLPGDLIQVGTATARIVAIDSTTHVLSLDRNLTWSAGQPVSLPFNGARPDMGAAER